MNDDHFWHIELQTISEPPKIQFKKNQDYCRFNFIADFV